jgi:hypothetical protein
LVPWRLVLEPWRLTMKPMKFTVEPWRFFTLKVADSRFKGKCRIHSNVVRTRNTGIISRVIRFQQQEINARIF